MADNPYNSMQSNLGIMPMMAPAPPPPIASPGETASRLMEQASQRATYSQQILQTTPIMAAQTFGAQFQQRFQQAQGMQSMSPYMAQALGGYATPGGGPSYLPSPLTMTPAQSGVFRPPMPSPISPIPPMYVPPIIPRPFSPNLPTPMFQTPWDQRATMQDMQSNRMFSYGTQAAGMAGQAVGLGAGAMMGSRLLGGMGPWGRLAGAVGGAALAGYSGMAGQLGDFSQLPFGPGIETRQMGAAAQRMSRDWVVTGSQLHAGGRGLTQQAATSLASGIKDLASDAGFRSSTGEMFNRQDLMRMTQLSGQAGMMDMAQSVPAIKSQLREVALSVKKFMELTNDPDVTNVIREMGQLRSFGMTLPQATQAAEGMRMFSRAAGTSVQGMREMGGMPGAMVYQGMGLSAGLGYNYGNYSLSMARQTVASGTVDPRHLAMLGGVQGIAQRNMQAQAAFTSMPLYGAANAQYGSRGWGVGGGGIGSQGATGMVNSALSNVNAAVRRGGIGALASFPLEQQEIADEAASRLTPMQQTAQRFRMASQTGKMLGLQGKDAFAAGARMMYGDEVANQMAQQMENPNFWNTQRQMYQQRSLELSQTYMSGLESQTPGFGKRLFRKTGLDKMAGGMARSAMRDTSVLGNAFSDMTGHLGDMMATPDGISRFRGMAGTGMTATDAAAVRGEDLSGVFQASKYQTTPGTYGFMGEWDRYRDIGRAGISSAGYDSRGGAGTAMTVGTSVFGITNNAAMAFGGVIAGGVMGNRAADKLVAQAKRQETDTIRIADRARRTKKDIGDLIGGSTAITKLLPRGQKGSGDGYNFLQSIADDLAVDAKDYLIFENKIGAKEMRDKVNAKLKAAGRPPLETLPEGEQQQILSKVSNMLAAKGPEEAKSVALGEGDARSEMYRDVDRATENIQELQNRDLQVLRQHIGGAATVGLMEMGYGAKSDEYKAVQSFMKGTDSKTAAVVAGLAAGNRGKAKDYFMKNIVSKSLTSKQKEDAWVKYAQSLEGEGGFLSRLGKEGKAALASVGGGNLQEVEKLATMEKAAGVTRSVRSETFMKDFAEHSSKVADAWAERSGQRITSVEDIARLMSGEELSGMEKSKDENVRKKAALIKQVKAGGAKGRAAAQQLNSLAALTGGSEVEDRAEVKPQGAAAEAAESSANASEEMMIVAQEFTPAVKDFKEAAKMMLDAEMYRYKNNNS